MSSQTIAQLVVSLEANIARFSTDIKSAADQTQRAMSTISTAANTAKAALGSLGVGLGVSEIANYAKTTIAAAAALDDFAESTGSSVESLSRLTNQAKVAGVPFDLLQTAINKLAAGMNGADDESTKVGKALSQLGISAKDPAEAFRQIALTLDKYADGTGKAAALADLFGKNWAAVLPALRAVIEEQDVQATVTAQQAAEAERLEKSWQRLMLQGGELRKVLLSGLVPAMADFTSGIVAARQAGMGWLDSLNLGTTYSDRLTASISQRAAEIDRLTKAIAKQAAFDEKDGRNYDPYLQKLQRQREALIKEQELLKSIQATRIQSNIALMGYTGDARDQRLGHFPGKQEIDYASVAGDAKVAKQAIADYADEIQKLNDAMFKSSGAGGGWDNLIRANEKLAADVKAGKIISTEQARQFVLAAVAADQEAQAQAALKLQIEEATKAREADIAAMEKNAEAATRGLGDFAEGNKALEREIALIGADDLARQNAIATKEYEIEKNKLLLASDVEGLQVLENLYQARLRLNGEMAQKSQAVGAARQYAQEWANVINDVTRGLSDFFTDLLSNGKSAFDHLWQSFKNFALRALADIAARQVVVSVLGAVGMTGAGAAAANGLGGLGNGSSLLGAAGSSLGIGNPYGAGFSLGANSWGGTTNPVISNGWQSAEGFSSYGSSFGGYATGALGGVGIGAGIGMATSALFGNGYNNSNMQIASTIGGAIGGAVAGPVGAIVGSLLGSAIGSLDSTGKPQERYGTWMSSTADTLPRGNTLFQGKSAFGAMGIVDDRWFSDQDMGSAVQTFLAGIAEVDNAIAGAVGPDVVGKIKTNLVTVTTEFGAGMEHGAVSFGEIVRQRYTSVLNTVEEGLGGLIDAYEGSDAEIGKFAVDLVNASQTIRQLDLNAIFGEAFSTADLEAFVAAGDTFSNTLNNLVAVFQVTNDAADLLGMTFGTIGLASASARQELVDFAGGAQALAAQLGYFAENFLTEQQRTTLLTQSLTKSFSDLNLALPASRDAFTKLLMDAAAVDSKEGRELTASLLALMPAVAQLYPKIDQLTDSMQRAAQVAQEREGLERRLLELQGNVVALRSLELAKLDPSNRALQQQIWELEDAQAAQQAYSNAVSSASSAYDAAAQAISSAQSAIDAIRSRGTDAYVSAQEKVAAAEKALADARIEVAKKLRDTAESLREFVNAQLGLGASGSSFAAVLAKALNLDSSAMSALPEAAKAAIEAAKGSASTSSEFNLARARILADVSRVAELAATEAAKTTIPTEKTPIEVAQEALIEAQKVAAEALRVATEIGAPLAKQASDLIDEYKKAVAALEKAQADQEAARAAMNAVVANTAATVKSIDALKFQIADLKLTTDAVINFVIGSDLPQDIKDLILSDMKMIQAVITFIEGSSTLSPELKSLALETAKTITLVTDWLVRAGLPEDLLRIAIKTQDVITRFFDFSVRTDTLTEEQRKLALAVSSDLTKTVQLIAGSTVAGDLKKLALETTSSYTTTLQLALAATTSDSLKTLLLQGSGVFTATIAAAMSTANLTPEARRILIDQSGIYTVNVGAIMSSSLTDEQKQILLQANTTSTRAVTILAALSNLTTEQQNILLNASTFAQRMINLAANGGTITADQWAAIRMGNETVSKTIVELMNSSNLTQADKNFLAAITGSSTGTLTLGGTVKWNPDAQMYSIWEAIMYSTGWLGEIHSYLGYIHSDLTTNSGGWLAGLHGYLGYIYGKLLGSIQIVFNRGDGSGTWAKGGAFTNSIVSSPTATNVGIMGEAGPEAIMPLTRASDGSLAVRFAGGSISEELTALREDSRAQARALVQLQSRLVRLLERWDGDGMPEVRAV